MTFTLMRWKVEGCPTWMCGPLYIIQREPSRFQLWDCRTPRSDYFTTFGAAQAAAANMEPGRS
jgi:hypothetical protein